MRIKHGVKPDNLSVTDQPGWTLLLVGLFISFLCGYSIKSFMSPQRLKTSLESAAARIHKDFDFKIGTAELSLADYGIPRFAVIAKDVRITTRSKCLVDSVIDVDQIEIPVNFFSVLKGQPEIRELAIGQIEWRLPKMDSECNSELFPNPSNNSAATSTQAVEAKPTAIKNDPIMTPSPPGGASRRTNQIRSIEIASLRLILTQYPQVPVQIQNATFEVLNDSPLRVKVKGKLDLFRDSKLSNFLTHSNVTIDYDEEDQGRVAASVVGNVREGSYVVHTQVDLKNKFVNLESQVQHFPVMELYPFFATSDLGKRIKDNKQLWLSAKFSLKSELEKVKAIPLSFTDLRLEGEALEFFSDHIELLSADPLKFSPFQIQIQKLSLDKLNEMLVQPMRQKSIGSFGQFRGALVVRNEFESSLAGELNGLEFIFSNKGERRIQRFQKLSLDVKRNKSGLLKVHVNRLEPEGGVLNGDVSVQYDPETLTSQIDLDVEELRLSPLVVDLMTDGGRFEGAKGHLQFKLHKEKIQNLKGRLAFNEFEIEGFAAKKASIDVGPESGKHKFRLAAQDIVWSRVSDGDWLFNSLKWPEELKFKQAKVDFKTIDFSTLDWSRASFQSEDQKVRVTSNGGWDSQGNIKGSLHYEHDRRSDHFNLLGTREKPIVQGVSK